MDAAILHDRIAATEKALIVLDERLDTLPDPTEALAACAARLGALEEQLQECLSQLTTLSNSATTTEAEVAQAEAAVAEAEAEIAQAEATEALVEALIAETETEAEMDGITEIPAEPEAESPSAAVPEKRPNFLERFLTVQ